MMSPNNPLDNHAHASDYVLHQVVSDALEVERRRLAQRLQTTLINQINLVLAQLHAYEQTASGQSRMAFSVLATLIHQLLQQAYDLEASLNPTTLETLGLVPALEALANQQRRTTGMEITHDLAYRRERLPLHIELVLLRITQEVMEQANIHGHATRIDLRLTALEHGIRYAIRANGLSASEAHWPAFHQRIAVLGGQLNISENSDRDLTIEIELTLGSPVDFTDREMDVICLLAEGLTNREIAAALDIRPRTVKFHLDNIYSKLGVSTRTEAAIYALRQGWVQRPPPA